jgi:RNA polymerase sigma-70 factor, ECF subfamily
LLDVDDEVLMARFVAGETEAFEVLYDRYESSVFGFCLRLLEDRARAEDALQDTFMTVVEQRFRYRDRGRFRSWVFTVAHNTCLDRVRLHERRSKLLSMNRSHLTQADTRPESSIESRDEVAHVLAALPPDQREIVLLHKYAGFSYAEIAEMTSSTSTAVKQKAYRALMTIRSQREA